MGPTARHASTGQPCSHGGRHSRAKWVGATKWCSRAIIFGATKRDMACNIFFTAVIFKILF
jgi:hypothetical protein